MSESSHLKEFWGQLIGPDDVPSARFRQLLTAIAMFIRESIEPVSDASLSPSKLAAFYRQCGHNHDSLFLQSSSPALSWVYQTIQCFHSLQPTMDPSVAPSIPTLTTDGFIRWQTVQLLLDPKAQVPVIQKAVQQFELALPDSDQRFPDTLPADCLPLQPSEHLTKWHDRQLAIRSAGTRQQAKTNVLDSDDDPSNGSRRRKNIENIRSDLSQHSPDIKAGWRYITSPPRTGEHSRSHRSPLSFGSAGPSPNRHRASDERRFYRDPFSERPTPRSTNGSPRYGTEPHPNGAQTKYTNTSPSSGITHFHNSADINSPFARRHSSAHVYMDPYVDHPSGGKDGASRLQFSNHSKARSLSRRPKSPPLLHQNSPAQRRRSTSRSSRPPPLHTNSRTRSVSHSSILDHNPVEQIGSDLATDFIAQDFANPYLNNETSRPQLGNLPKSKSGRGRRAMTGSENVA